MIAALSVVALALSAEYVCPGSPVSTHAHCEVTAADVDGACSAVVREVQARASGSGGWVDPHNGGHYTVFNVTTEADSVLIRGKRVTGNAPGYTDMWNLALYSTSNTTCTVAACSESQVTSLGDGGTNFCNVHNLYCGTDDGCKPVEHDFTYKEQVGKCTQADKKKCLQ